MQAKFMIRRRHYTATQAYLLLHRPDYLLSMFSRLAGLPLTIYIVLQELLERPPLFAAASAITWLTWDISWTIFGIGLQSILKSNEFSGGLTPQIYTISPAGIRYQSSTIDLWTSWRGIYDVVVSDQALYVFTSRLTISYIPFDAFPDRDSAMQFAELARAHWSDVRAGRSSVEADYSPTT